MKIIFECKWFNHTLAARLRSHKPYSESVAFVSNTECHIFFPDRTTLPCLSIEDGKAKAIEHLRNAGVLVEDSAVNAELLEALKTALVCITALPQEVRPYDAWIAPLQAAIAKAEGEE